MSKVEISPAIAPFPKPIALVGSSIDGKPNFMNIAWINRMNRSPNIIAASINTKHYTLEGIRQNGCFSINFPGTGLVERTDYVGLVSGRDVDKSSVFKVFYGELEGAPMIEECPVCMECSVLQYVELPDHVIVLGEVLRLYTEEKYMTDGALDPKKMDPIVFTRPGPIGTYWHLGEAVAQAWSVGKRLKENG
ncbi:MAG: flavin reductase family protein [Candidatus Thorarchaeota archaeon]|nr:MAG: flavin reductase family protein [Candidatus Thorarchaeota archaeon]